MRLEIATRGGTSGARGIAEFLDQCGMCGRRFMSLAGDRVFSLEKGENAARTTVCRQCATQILLEHENDLAFSVKEGNVETSAFWVSEQPAAGGVTIIEK